MNSIDKSTAILGYMDKTRVIRRNTKVIGKVERRAVKYKLGKLCMGGVG